MSEENKTVELKDEELEKVSGGKGVSTTIYCYSCGYDNFIDDAFNSTFECPICHSTNIRITL